MLNTRCEKIQESETITLVTKGIYSIYLSKVNFLFIYAVKYTD